MGAHRCAIRSLLKHAFDAMGVEEAHVRHEHPPIGEGRHIVAKIGDVIPNVDAIVNPRPILHVPRKWGVVRVLERVGEVTLDGAQPHNDVLTRLEPRRWCGTRPLVGEGLRTRVERRLIQRDAMATRSWGHAWHGVRGHGRQRHVEGNVREFGLQLSGDGVDGGKQCPDWRACALVERHFLRRLTLRAAGAVSGLERTGSARGGRIVRVGVGSRAANLSFCEMERMVAFG